MEGGEESTVSLGGLRTYARSFAVEADELKLVGLAAFVETPGRVVSVLAVTTAEDWNDRRGELTGALWSLLPLTDRGALAAEPARLAIVELPRTMTLAELAAAYPSAVPLETLALINGVEPGTVLAAGTRVKRVVGGRHTPPP